MWLARLVDATRDRLEAGYYDKRPQPPPSPPEGVPDAASLRRAIERARPAVLAEIKPARPEGAVRDVDIAQQAKAYAAGGACGISVLTDPDHFGGALENLATARQAGLPVLMKDFLLDTRQIDAAAAWGASAVLVIARLHDEGHASLGLGEAIEAAHAAGLEALVEVVTEDELDAALTAGADVVGINTRDLDSLEMDASRVERLLDGRDLPVPVLWLSGISSGKDVRRALKAGADGVLVGTAVMAADDPARAVRELTQVTR